MVYCSVMNDCLDLCDLLRNVSHECEKEMNAVLSKLEMSHCQARLLLGIQSGNTSVSGLSVFLCCNKSNVTQVIDGLVERRLITRVASSTDGRVKILSLTAKGRAACDALQDVVCDCADDSMSVFTKAEKALLEKLLRKYVEARNA